MFRRVTTLVEPLSLDEAFLDMTGTARLHGQPPAMMLARLVRRMKTELGLTGSIGLSHNKFLAKVASDVHKPDGLTVIEQHEVDHDLGPLPVHKIWGIGPTTAARLDSVQQSLARVVAQGELPQVIRTHLPPAGTPADIIDLTYRKLGESVPDPRLPPASGDGG